MWSLLEIWRRLPHEGVGNRSHSLSRNRQVNYMSSMCLVSMVTLLWWCHRPCRKIIIKQSCPVRLQCSTTTTDSTINQWTISWKVRVYLVGTLRLTLSTLCRSRDFFVLDLDGSRLQVVPNGLEYFYRTILELFRGEVGARRETPRVYRCS
jgi:hypothetical protein